MEITTNIRSKTFPRLLGRLGHAFLLWENPFSAVFLSFVIYTAIASLPGAPWRVTTHAYYNYLADAFLHGQLSLRIVPPITLDLSLFQGKYYLYWGPLPAIIAMPFVMIFGVGFSDILQTIAFGSINAGLFALLLRKMTVNGYLPLDPARRSLLVLFFTFGTMVTPIVTLGNVWHLVQLIFLTCCLLGFLAVFSFTDKKAFFYVGFAMSGVLLTRPSGIFVAIFLAWYLLSAHWQTRWRRLINYCLIGLLPCLASLMLVGLYNYLRFGNLLETGYSYHQMNTVFVSVAKQYGVLSTHYIPINLYLNYIYNPFTGFSEKIFYTKGGSLFLLSPLCLAVFNSFWRDRRDVDTWVLFLSFLLGNIPASMIMAPGAYNFGPRYLIEVMVPLLLLTAKGSRRWPIWIISILVVVSIVEYLIGTIMMGHVWAVT